MKNLSHQRARVWSGRVVLFVAALACLATPAPMGWRVQAPGEPTIRAPSSQGLVVRVEASHTPTARLVQDGRDEFVTATPVDGRHFEYRVPPGARLVQVSIQGGCNQGGCSSCRGNCPTPDGAYLRVVRVEPGDAP
ncbi:MAG: hypothetical protein HY909_19110 [Deltaproteobacteria bacterium]|nr:hypothetical protein [Deltaproteobacteria bacterium]